ncbi:hypothetical protein SAMN04487934_10250 [Eubacterium ruminantium]|nr:hypothetical protein SAMN04487934_10250 [Eubacterium ruminantium]
MRKKNKKNMKMYTLLLTAGLIISLSGCGKTDDTTSTTEKVITTEATTEKVTQTEASSDTVVTTENTTEAIEATEEAKSNVSGSFIAKEDIQINETYDDTSDGGHAIEADGETAEYSNIAVTKTGEADGDEADFYGENAAIFATNGATLTFSNITVDTDGKHANGVFSYGEGTTVNISDSYIYTSNNCSGGLMTTGGGTMNAANLTIVTDGNSSAAIRSDRGGGTVTVTNGSYTTNGTGSPVIYSTADITVNDAVMTSTASQGVVVEGQNSVTLNNVTLTADNNTKNSDKSEYYQAVMIYQSMSGDADEGTASFTMNGGSLTNKNGDIFFVNNTVATIDLENVEITNEDAEGVFLRAAAAGWGSEGSNGGNVTLNAKNQTINGNIIVDEVSTLNMYLTEGTILNGAINSSGEAGDVYVELSGGSVWTLTGDSYITSLTCDADSINLNGYKLYIDGQEYIDGTASTGTAVEAKVAESSGHGGHGGGDKPEGDSPSGDKPEGEPPAKPE